MGKAKATWWAASRRGCSHGHVTKGRVLSATRGHSHHYAPPTCTNATTCHLERRKEASERTRRRKKEERQSGALEKRLSAVKNAGRAPRLLSSLETAGTALSGGTASSARPPPRRGIGAAGRKTLGSGKNAGHLPSS